MTESVKIFDTGFRVTDSTGFPVSNAQISFFQAGPAMPYTPLTVYADAGLTIPLGSTIYTSSDGLPVIGGQRSNATTAIYTGTAPYKLQINDANGNPIIPVQDNIKGAFSTVAASFGLQKTTFTSVSSNYTATSSDIGTILNCNTTSGAFTVTFPSAAGLNGQGFAIKNIGTGGYPVVYASVLGQTIDGAAIGSIYAENDCRTFVSDGDNWIITPAVTAQQIPGSVTNLHISWNNSRRLNVSCDEVVMISSGGLAMRATSVSLIIDCTVNGVNGLDVGVFLGDNDWYYIYLISNGTTTAGIASLNSTAPTLPSGYVFYKRCGSRPTDGSAQFYVIEQYGRHHQYRVGVGNVLAYPNLANGSAGTVAHTTAPSWATVSMSAYVSPTATEAILLYMNKYNNATASIVQIASNSGMSGDQSTNPPLVSVAAGSVVVGFLQFLIEPASSNSVYWTASQAGGAIFALGYIDNF